MADMSRSRRRVVPLAIVSAAILCGIGLRLRGLTTEFWLDEIWSLRIAQEARSLFEIYVAIPADNNHPLNTTYLYLIGNHSNWIWYRLMSFGCGLITIALMFRAVTTEVERVVMAIFASLSLPMIVYSTEARGYAPAAMFGFAAFVAARKRRNWLMAVMATLAMLSHLTAIYVYAGLLAAAIVRRIRGEIRSRELLPHVLPCSVAYLIVVVFVRRMSYGGGPPRSPMRAAIDATSRIGGWSDNGSIASLIVAALVLGIIVFELVRRRADRGEAAFLFVAMFAAPAAVLVAIHRNVVYDRYFFVEVPFAFLLLASFCGWLWRFAPAAVVVIVAAWIAATAVQLTPFLRYGRGEYIEALRYMAATSGGTAEISAREPFPNATVIGFASSYLGPGQHVRFHPPGDRRFGRTDWWVIEAFTPTTVIPPLIELPGGFYRRVKTFPFGGVSGWNWVVFRRLAPRHVPTQPDR